MLMAWLIGQSLLINFMLGVISCALPVQVILPLL